METLNFEIEIVAPVQTVWSTMLDDDTYRQWTSSFHEGSYYTGDWEKGSTIRFLGPDEAGGEPGGTDGGMLGTVVESRPNELVQILPESWPIVDTLWCIWAFDQESDIWKKSEELKKERLEAQLYALKYRQ